MGDAKWTKEQQMAIDTRGCNLLVAAAAGSGKTAVLVERIIKIITNNEKLVDIDKLLVVTFTNAAAAEMRERIGAAISKALDQNPDSKLLQRQMTLLNKASITTIHSFCLDVIKSNFHKIDLDPNFRIADETESILLKQETINELFEKKYVEKDSEGAPIEYEGEMFEEITRDQFVYLVECYGGSKDDIPLQQIVLSLYEFVMSGPWPKKWLEDMYEVFNVKEDFDFGKSKWGIILKDDLKLELTGYKKRFERAVDLIETASGLEPYLNNFQEELGRIRELIEKCETASWEELYYSFSSFEFGRLKSCKKDADKDTQEIVKNIRDEIKDKINAIKKDIFCSGSAQIKGYLQELYPLMKSLANLVLEFDKTYKEKKRERGLLDFNDLEHLCLNILVTKEEGKTKASETALEVRERYEEILIDEYQDSNKVQEEILTVISRKYEENPNVFMVGDVKQSIYRFRQAEPGLFLEKYMLYSDENGAKNRKITLFKNFRSRKEVIDSVNYIFKQIMSTHIGEIEYDDREALNLGADYKKCEDEEAVVAGAVELHIIDKSDSKEIEDFEAKEEQTEDSEGEEEEEELGGIELEAKMVAKRIKELMVQKDGRGFKVFDKNINDYRNVQYSDIVILLRATSKWALIFMEEFEASNIPAYADTNSGYFDTIEIQTMLSLLQIIDNPMQDIPLLAVLRSPIFSFTPEELIDVRIRFKELTFFEAILKIIEEKEAIGEEDIDEEEVSKKLVINKKWYEEESKEIAVDAENGESLEVSNRLIEKIEKFMKKFHKWRKKSIHMPIDELIWYLYTDTGYYGYAAAMPGGVQRQANLRILFQRAKQFEQTSYKGLFNFINFINKLKTSSGDMGSAKILGENDNVVRIMSIHKSKGLEFPVVILAGTGKKFNLMDMNRIILFHQELGLGPNYVDPIRRITYQTILKQAIKKKIKLESLSEEMRVLYVAFTRAKEKLIITGSVNSIKSAASIWSSSAAETENSSMKIPEIEIIKGRNYLDWIGLSLVKHKDGLKLRQIAESELQISNFINDESVWEIKFWNKSSILEDNVNKDIINESEDTKTNEEPAIIGNFMDKEKFTKETAFKEEINKRLDWKYTYKMASFLPANLSVTELKRQAEGQFVEEDISTNMYQVPTLIKKPMFLEETKGLTAAERGTALHSVMQHLNLKNVLTKEEIKKQMDEMVYNEIITEEQSRSVNLAKITEFFKSSLGIRMLKAENIRREMLFHIELKSTDIYKELPKDVYEKDTIMLQGAIDCYFEEEDDVILVDYKTDYVTEENIEEIKERYRMQIEYYSEALRRMTKKKVKERYIYLFGNGMIIKY